MARPDYEALVTFLKDGALERADYLSLGVKAEDYELMQFTPRQDDVDQLLVQAFEIAPERPPGEVLYIPLNEHGDSPMQVCIEGDPIRAKAMLAGIELQLMAARDDADHGVPVEWT